MFGLVSNIFLAIFITTAAANANKNQPKKYSAIKNNYSIWCIGSCANDRNTTNSDMKTKAGVVLMGGGTDTDEAFIWQIGNADGGDFVVIRTSGDDAYNPYIYDLSVTSNAELNSVTTILFKNKDASAEEEVLSALSRAEAIFMAGGDQSEYLEYWRGTKVQSIIQSKLSNEQVTIGGTSAGCMVLGNWVYSADAGSITSEEALYNPYDEYLTIANRFLNIPFLSSFITDTHFVTRDRMGRLLTFLARIRKDYSSSGTSSVVHGIGIDEHTALLLDVNSGDVSAVGVNTAYLCTADHNAEMCLADHYLTYKDVNCVRLNARNNDKYSFAKFSGDGNSYTNNVVSGKFTTLPYGPK